MIEGAIRHYCRHCRGKLAIPTANHREAFDSKGCHRSFYRKRCLVCEESIEQPKRGERLICKKSNCINAFRNNPDLYHYHGGRSAELIPKTPDFIDSKAPLEPDRGWFVVAGPEPTPIQFHCAIVGARTAVDETDRTNTAHRRAAKTGDPRYRRDFVC
jgi:hypothetical protein